MLQRGLTRSEGEICLARLRSATHEQHSQNRGHSSIHDSDTTQPTLIQTRSTSAMGSAVLVSGGAQKSKMDGTRTEAKSPKCKATL